MPGPLIVLKLGGSVLRDDSDLRLATHEVYRWVRAGWKVVVVVSALKGDTDSLLRTAGAFGPGGTPCARALLAGTGELVSASLLSLALGRAGLAATVAPPWRIGLGAAGDPLDASPVGVDRARVESILTECDVAVVPGFVAVGGDGGLVLLGRGGSDLTALYLAWRLGGARCRLIKDVGGLYESDPAAPGERPRCFERVTWSQAAEIGGRVLQGKALRFAASQRVTFEVGALLSDEATIVGDEGPMFRERGESSARGEPLGVTLLGCGTVGGGVLKLLLSQPERFDVRRIVVRDIAKAAAAGIPAGLLCMDAGRAAREESDVVVEAMGGIEPAAAAINAALQRGATVVTANKAVVAAHGWREGWREAAADGRLRCSAAVGGAAPMLEAARRLASRGTVHRAEGIVNATTNYVLDRLIEGGSWHAAIRSAQAAGFAEADPARDLDGRDAADKLVLLARAAWDERLDPEEVARTPLTEAVAAGGVIGGRGGADEWTLRQVASVWREGGPGGRLRAEVGLKRVTRGRAATGAHDQRSMSAAAGRPCIACSLHGTRDDWNALVLTDEERARTIVRGRGAGRWPTAEAVMADLLDVHRERKARSREQGVLVAEGA